MKKTFFSVMMCLIGMCSMYAVNFAGTPIQFVEIYGVMPCDDGENGDGGAGRPDPNQELTGTVNGNNLNIGVGNGEAGEVVVVDSETGEVVVDEEFEGETTVVVPEAGNYTAYVVVNGTTYAGGFVVP